MRAREGMGLGLVRGVKVIMRGGVPDAGISHGVEAGRRVRMRRLARVEWRSFMVAFWLGFVDSSLSCLVGGTVYVGYESVPRRTQVQWVEEDLVFMAGFI